MPESVLVSAIDTTWLLSMTGWIGYILENSSQFVQMLQEHLRMVVIGVSGAILVAVPGGIAATRHQHARKTIMNAGAVAQTIPPLGVIALSFAFLGVGQRPVILALFLYALLPILKNTVAGIQSVDDAQIEAGRGMGMTRIQRLRRIELPLALPVIFAGIRTSLVLSVGVAYLGAFIGAGGFGQWIVLGQELYDTDILLAGAIPGAALVILLDQAFSWVEGRLSRTGASTENQMDQTVA